MCRSQITWDTYRTLILTKRFAVLSSTGGSVIREVYSRTCREEFRLDLVMSDRECGALDFASEFGIHYKKLVWSDPGNASALLLNMLEVHQIDILYLFFTRLLPADFVRQYQGRIINFHPSLLPLHPGLRAFERSLASGSMSIGITSHYVDEGMDTGEVILQVKNLTNGRSHEELRHLIFSQTCALLLHIHKMLCTEQFYQRFRPSMCLAEEEFQMELDPRTLCLYRTLRNRFLRRGN